MNTRAHPADRRAAATLGTVKKPNNDVRQSSRSNHERCSECQHIKRATTERCGVLLKTKINQDKVELIEEIHIATGQCGAQA